MKKILTFEVAVYVEDGEDTDEVFEKLSDAVDALCDGVEDDHHDCRLIGAGGCVQSEADWEERMRWEEYAAEMQRLEREKKNGRPKRRRKPE